MNRPRRHATALGVGIAMLLTAILGCSNQTAETNAPVASEDLVVQTVRTYVEDTVAAMGNATYGSDKRYVNSNPCDNDGHSGIHSTLAIEQLRVPSGEAIDTIHRLRDHWASNGYTITKEDYSTTMASGDLSAMTPDDHYSLAIHNGENDTIFVLYVVSPCYRSASPSP